MKVFIKGKGSVDLHKNDFLAAGGEGQIFVRGNTAYKIYSDPQKMIPAAKVQELSSLTEPYIVRPQDILLNSKNHPIGYTMSYVPDTYALCQLFTKAFKDRNKVTPEMVFELVQKMRKGIQFVHDRNILIVDLNELNFLVDKRFDDVYFIDVDSYQTRSFPATAIMDSIRDRHSKKFSEGTDWFSFGIVSFQMMIGVHPYKGKHSAVKTLDDRMMKNISVLNPAVSIPAVCTPLSVLPDVWKAWYKAVFEDGKRIAPPDGIRAAIVLTPIIKKVNASNCFIITEISHFTSEVHAWYSLDGHDIAVTSNGTVFDGNTLAHIDDSWCFTVTPKGNKAVAIRCDQGAVEAYDMAAKAFLPVSIAGEAAMACDDRVYIKNDESLNEIQFVEMGKATMLVAKPVANVMAKATHLFDGVVVQNLLGNWFASFMPKSETSYQTGLKELNGYKIVSAKHDNHVLMVIGNKSGQYDKFIFRLNSDYSSYDLRIVSDIAYTGINFVVLDNGICAHITDKEEMELFSNRVGSQDIKLINDPSIDSDMRLAKNGTQVMFSKDKAIYSIKSKTS